MSSAALIVFLLLLATTQESNTSNQTNAAPPAVGTSEVCPVTLPDRAPAPGTHYGNQNLWVAISPKGEMQVQRREDGLWAPKVAWVRGVHGRLTITGRRLDASAAPMKSVVKDAYGDIGFQPTSLVFPSEGCWEVTGSVGETKLTFVTEVRVLKNW